MTDTYNHKVFFIENEDERDQCQFVYVPLNGGSTNRCQRDGIYRIGLTIFLCGIHMPGVGRHRTVNVSIETEQIDKHKISDRSVHGKLLKMLTDNIGEIVTYRDIEMYFPQFSIRGNLHVAVSQLRKKTGINIISVPLEGYKIERLDT